MEFIHGEHLVLDNGTQAIARMKSINGIVRLVHAIEDVRNEVINGQVTSQMLFDQLGDVGGLLYPLKAVPFQMRPVTS